MNVFDNPRPRAVLRPEPRFAPEPIKPPAWWCRWSLAIVEGPFCPLCGCTKAASTDTKGMVLQMPTKVRLPKAEHYIIAAEHELNVYHGSSSDEDWVRGTRAEVNAVLSLTAAMLAIRDELAEVRNLLLAQAIDAEREP